MCVSGVRKWVVVGEAFHRAFHVLQYLTYLLTSGSGLSHGAFALSSEAPKERPLITVFFGTFLLAAVLVWLMEYS